MFTLEDLVVFMTVTNGPLPKTYETIIKLT